VVNDELDGKAILPPGLLLLDLNQKLVGHMAVEYSVTPTLSVVDISPSNIWQGLGKMYENAISSTSVPPAKASVLNSLRCIAAKT
jgi:hypothetical protein